MKSEKLIDNRSDEILLFFNGWGFSPRAVSHLKSDRFDVLAFDSYHRGEDFDLSAFEKYRKKYLLAWSMGVWAASGIDFGGQLEQAVAVNGTPLPSDDRYGIPEKIFQGTLSSLDERNMEKFLLRVAGGNRELYGAFGAENPRSFEDRREELEYWSRNLDRPVLFQGWDTAWVSSQDRIFPFPNQQNYYRERGILCRVIQTPHYPFGEFSLWEDFFER